MWRALTSWTWLIKDSKGIPSWSHTLAVPALILMTIRFLLGGFNLVIASHAFLVPVWAASEYVMAAGLWMTFLTTNSVVSKKYDKPPEPGVTT